MYGIRARDYIVAKRKCPLRKISGGGTKIENIQHIEDQHKPDSTGENMMTHDP